MRMTPGTSLENAARSMLSSMPRENSLPSSAESISRSITMRMRLGPLRAWMSCGVVAFFSKYKPAV